MLETGQYDPDRKEDLQNLASYYRSQYEELAGMAAMAGKALQLDCFVLMTLAACTMTTGADMAIELERSTIKHRGKAGGVRSGKTRKAKANAQEEHEKQLIRAEIAAHPKSSNRQIANSLIEKGCPPSRYDALRKLAKHVRMIADVQE
ncbi:hypothetical protein LMG27198_26690 [Methylocystis echinoides]|uniref:Uncharacterized protein n=2 Tax=Methylocystis echinoides TaxID=29468 RepID=A0A9W6GVA9_9HYPH|nr:hypothetical protein LMG27198_26690 [Methylocystis echinoides]